MLEGILFDSEGVLLDSEEIYFRAVGETFSQYGINIYREEYVRRWMIEQTTIPGVIEDYQMTESYAELKRIRDEIWEGLFGEIKIMPGAKELLDNFHGRYPLGVVSSAHRNQLEIKLGMFDITRYFKFMLGGNDVSRKKPHPEPYLRGCELLGKNPGNVLVLEDTPSGVSSAKDAGCKVIAYPNGFTLGLDFSRADRVVSSLFEIDNRFVERMFS